MNEAIESETVRQYRVLRQTLSIHSILRDRYTRKANIVDSILLVSSVIFCATTFASEELYKQFGVSLTKGQFILGFASIIAFCCSILLFIAGWREKAIQHRDAADKWSEVLSQFRSHKIDSDTWQVENVKMLSDLYWETSRNTVKIPEADFTELKSAHLRKVSLSKMKDKYPTCPRFILSLILLFRDTKSALFGKENE